MKKALAIAGILALTFTQSVSFADHLELRENNIRAWGNLYHANLRDEDLSGADLSGANLIEADLSGADLRGTDLTRANLIKANLTGADLTGADLTGAKLTGEGSILSGCPSYLPNGWVCEDNSLRQR